MSKVTEKRRKEIEIELTDLTKKVQGVDQMKASFIQEILKRQGMIELLDKLEETETEEEEKKSKKKRPSADDDEED